ncbi:MAG: dihydroneopterin aldolase [Bacillus thermozeamaize]|jgi:dihydroneopterin aldolase|uniref:7,8-dihydroneopterin aldolase n=1 Tax=Bacillus thermozeamaize TaxID=230954 RepID=A0A1Y3PJL9_9BACI|nr:MAG: dihydroneopterin aldolase [Bacillus thermozeamaize]
MDKIVIQGMTFYGYHGVYEEERRLGQRFVVDVWLYLDLNPAGQSDRLADTVNYAEVYDEVARVFHGPSRQLLESLAEETAARLLKRFRIHKVTVRIMKPSPPIPGHFQHVGVEITREASD